MSYSQYFPVAVNSLKSLMLIINSLLSRISFMNYKPRGVKLRETAGNSFVHRKQMRFILRLVSAVFVTSVEVTYLLGMIK